MSIKVPTAPSVLGGLPSISTRSITVCTSSLTVVGVSGSRRGFPRVISRAGRNAPSADSSFQQDTVKQQDAALVIL